MRIALVGVVVVALGASLIWFFYPEKTDAAYVREQVTKCLETGEFSWRGKCFRELAPHLFSKLTLEKTLHALAEIDEEDGIKQQCHSLVHFLGQEAYRTSRDLPKAFAQCSSAIACGEGCYHGAVEAYIEETGDQLEGASIAKICSRDFTGNEVNYQACVHGIGHAFMLLSGGEVLQSLPKCDFLAAGDREDCYAGIFMENVFGAGSLDHPAQYLKRDDPMYPCTIVEDRYKNVCYSSQVDLVMPPGPTRYEVGRLYCADVPAAYRADCFGSLGGDIVLFTENPAEVAAVCETVPEGAARVSCFKNALKFRGHGTGGNVERIAEICFAAEKKGQESCFKSAGQFFEDWYPGQRAEKCANVNARGTDVYAWCAE